LHTAVPPTTTDLPAGSNWENGCYSAVGRRIETPFMNMKYRTIRHAIDRAN
jgi:hypothetical protein